MLLIKDKNSSFGFFRLLSRISEITIAPAFIKGFRGMPLSASSWTRELNAVPEGSTPSLVQIFSPRILYAKLSESTFAILWIENFSLKLPIPKLVWSIVDINTPKL